MPLALFWEESRPGQQVKQTPGEEPAAVLQVLLETFGRDPNHPNTPVELNRGHIFTLRSLGPAMSTFHTIAELIELHGSIRLWSRSS